MGLGSFIIYQVLPLIKSGQLKIVLNEFETPAKALHLLYPESRLLPARTRLLIEWIKKDIDQIKHEWIA
jgi:DNA-binding transcriptional LysR family regulator